MINSVACERIVVFNKRDLVSEWGLEVNFKPRAERISISDFYSAQPFRRAMSSRFPDQQFLFASWQRPRDIRDLSEMLVSASPPSSCELCRGNLIDGDAIDIAKKYPYAMELNVLVIGMPNVGKSTLLNALRNMGIKGRPSPASVSIAASQQFF